MFEQLSPIYKWSPGGLAKVLEIVEGTSEIQRMIISRRRLA
ncbi:MAG: hypothetical protein ACTS6J_05225 [Burkholderiales bacterium]